MAKKQVKKRASTPAARKARARTASKPLKKKKIARRRPVPRPARKGPAKAAKAKVRKPARAVTKVPVRKPAARKAAKKVQKAAPKAPPKAARKAPPKAAPKAPPKAAPTAAKRVAPVAEKVRKPVAARPRRAALPPPAALQRPRRRLPETDAEAFVELSEDSRLMSSARAGHDELRSEMLQHTEASPELTAGDVDAKWQDAYALGDEAPGGDNMTPDQDRVDDIGKALGIEYADDEELMGGEEVTARDEHRWELDPASKEDEDE